MSIKITPKTFGMAQEERQLEEIIQKVASAEKGETILFPEYGAYTPQGSETAFAELSRVAVSQNVTIITTLNLPSDDLPGSEPGRNYNTLFIFSRNGRVYSPQAKITPQSFEMRHLDESYPRMDVAPYSRLNRVTLNQNGVRYSTFFLICSDLYVLQMFDFAQLQADIIACPSNFGNGAEGSAGEVIDYTVKSGMFQQGFYCNTYQNVKEGLIPLTVRVKKVYVARKENLGYDREAMKKILEKSSVTYREEEYHNFMNMLKLTQNGTFTVPRSRSLENGLKVELGEYPTVVEL